MEPRGAVTLAQLQALREAWRDEGQRVVFTNGCFDLLHVGHLRYLRRARALGDRLVIALNDDASTHSLKGEGRPILPFDERAELLMGLRIVDAVVGFHEPTALRVLRALSPDVYVKGGDYDAAARRPPEADLAEWLGAEVVFLPFVDGRSTSELLIRIRRGEGLSVLDSEAGSSPKTSRSDEPGTPSR